MCVCVRACMRVCVCVRACVVCVCVCDVIVYNQADFAGCSGSLGAGSGETSSN